MRLPIPLALACTLALAPVLAGCGGDEPEPDAAAARPAPQRPVVDTTIGDTVALADSAAADSAAADSAAASASAAGDRGAGPTSGRAADAGAGRAAGAAGATAGGASSESRLYTVQVGAFVESETARSWESRLASQGLPVWVSIAELRGATYYRLRVGAVGTVADARRLGRMITDRFEWPVWVAPLSPADTPPEGTLERSRRLLDEG